MDLYKLNLLHTLHPETDKEIMPGLPSPRNRIPPSYLEAGSGDYGECDDERNILVTKSVKIIRHAVLRMLAYKRRLRKNNLNIAFDSGFVDRMHGTETVDDRIQAKQLCRLVCSLRPVNVLEREPSPYGKGKVTVKDILIFLERGSFNAKVNFIDIVFRGAVMAFFSSFLPLMTFVAYIFLFLHVAIQLFQLLYYNRRPSTINRHSQPLLSWTMYTMHDIAVPFVVFYWVTVSWSMLLCPNPILKRPDLGALSLGVYYCPSFTSESLETMNVVRFIVGLIATPLLVCTHRMVQHCVKKSPTLVRHFSDKLSARRFAKLEARYLEAHVNEELRTKLGMIYQHRLVIEKQLLRAMRDMKAYHNNDKLEKQLQKKIELSVVEGLDSESKLVLTASLLLHHGARTQTMSAVIENLDSMHVDDDKELATWRAEQLVLAILSSSRKENDLSSSYRSSSVIYDIAHQVETTKIDNFKSLRSDFHAIARRVNSEFHTGHLSSKATRNLLKFLHFLRRCINTANQPTDNSMGRDYTITTQANLVEEAISQSGSGLWVSRREPVGTFTEQKISEKSMQDLLKNSRSSIVLPEPEEKWEQMSMEERHFFVKQSKFYCLKPVSTAETIREQDAVLDICAENGLNPFAYHLRIPGEPFQRVGTVNPDELNPESAEARMLLSFKESPTRIHTRTLRMLWSGLQCVREHINRANYLRTLQGHLDMDNINYGSVSQDTFIKQMYRLMNDEMLLERRFHTSAAALRISIDTIAEKIQLIEDPTEESKRQLPPSLEKEDELVNF